MKRSRRAAAPTKLHEDLSASEEQTDDDFSASEEEWLPDHRTKQDTTQGDKAKISAYSQDSDDFTDTEELDYQTNLRNQNRKRLTCNIPSQLSKKKRLSPNTRDIIYNRAKINLPGNTNIADILNQCKFKKRPSISVQNKSESSAALESDSSGDDHLVNADALDLNSRFFNSISSHDFPTATPQFDCNAGLNLLDQSDNERDNANAHMTTAAFSKCTTEQLIDSTNHTTNGFMNFNNMDEYQKKMEEAKLFLTNYQKNQFEQNTESNSNSIANLLAQGENSIKNQTHRRSSECSDESDWENVEDIKRTQQNNDPTEDFNISVEIESSKSKKKRWEELEMELYIKRQINKIKRDNQLAFHKSSVLCFLAVGKKLNEIVNSDKMLSVALSLMQSKECFLKGQPDAKFVENLMSWFRKNFSLNIMECLTSIRFSLSLDLFTKKVVSRRNYVLLFLTFLRAVGVQSRLVLSAAVPPKRPAMKDLCTISEHQLIKNVDKVLSKTDSSAKEVASSKNLTISNKPATEKSKLTVMSTVTNSRSIEKKENLNSVGVKRKSNSRIPLAQTSANENNKINKTELSDSSNTFTIKSSQPIKVETKLTRSNLTRKTRSSNGVQPNILNVPQLDGGDDFNDTPKSVPRVRALRSRTKLNIDNKTHNTGSPFNTRNKNSPLVKQEIIQPGKVSKRKLFNVNTNVISTTSKEKCTNKRLVKNKILVSGSSESEFEEIPTRSKSFKSRPDKRETRSKLKMPIKKSKNLDDSDFESPGKHNKNKGIKTVPLNTEGNKLNKKLVKTKKKDISTLAVTTSKTDLWVEFYCQKNKRWLTVDVFSGKIDCVDYIVRHTTAPISYVFGFDNNNYIKDVTPRYVNHWNTVCRKLRVDSKWLQKALQPFLALKDEVEKHEDIELNKIHIDKPLPTTITECKNHPLYVLKRHLLKYEALYPPDLPSLGFVRGEAIYSRECLYILQTREKWYRQGRVVKPFESAYKVVKSWRYDKLKNEWLYQPCDIFGLWQTTEYDPPTAENGIVPRNEYGNVELFTPKMLPKKTVYLQLPGLNKVCKRLKIDCAPVITGFDMARMRMIPIYDGFVVCEEFANQVVEEWYKEMEEEDRKEQERFEKRVYGNWKRLIKGLLVRRKLQNKYNFDNL